MDDLLHLDTKGLLPWNGEAEHEFVVRGVRTILSSNMDRWHQELIHKARLVLDTSSAGYRSIEIAQDTKRVRRFRRGIAAFGHATGADLSWIPIVQYWQSEFDRSHDYHSTVAGFSSCILGSEPGYYLPFIGVNTLKITLVSPYASGAHEAFHAIRRPLFGPTCSVQANEFEHLGSLVVSPVKRALARDIYGRQFQAAWRELRRAFGKDAGYVMVRLSYDELIQKIIGKFYGMNPRQYLAWAAGFKDNLRHRIMAERLGL